MSNTHDAAQIAVIERFKGIVHEYQQNSEFIAARQKRQVELEAHAQDCYAAARLFGFDIAHALAAQSNGVQDTTPPPIEERQQPVLPKAKKIADFILEEAEKAYPHPIQATPMREKLEQLRGEKLHEKTVGMTLYRLSREGIMRREGMKDWFFVPADQRRQK
jgi:hypothetical protein